MSQSHGFEYRFYVLDKKHIAVYDYHNPKLAEKFDEFLMDGSQKFLVMAKYIDSKTGALQKDWHPMRSHGHEEHAVYDAINAEWPIIYKGVGGKI